MTTKTTERTRGSQLHRKHLDQKESLSHDEFNELVEWHKECFSAIEAVGGDPETVGEMAAEIRRLEITPKICACGETRGVCRQCRVRALLAKIGGES